MGSIELGHANTTGIPCEIVIAIGDYKANQEAT